MKRLNKHNADIHYALYQVSHAAPGKPAFWLGPSYYLRTVPPTSDGMAVAHVTYKLQPKRLTNADRMPALWSKYKMQLCPPITPGECAESSSASSVVIS